MHSVIAIAALLGQAVVQAQNPPAATPSNAVIIGGDASYDGPVIPGTTGKLGDAQVVTGNPVGVTYRLDFPNVPTSNIRGYVSASAPPNGVGAMFTVSLSGLPDASIGPFCKLPNLLRCSPGQQLCSTEIANAQSQIKCIIFMWGLYRHLATALRQESTSIHTSVVPFHRATTPNRPPAKWEICPASTATSPAALSQPGMFFRMHLNPIFTMGF